MDQRQDSVPDVRTDLHGTGSGDSQAPPVSSEETKTGTDGDSASAQSHAPKKSHRKRAKAKSWREWSRRRVVEKRIKTTKRHGVKGRKKWNWGYLNSFRPVHLWTKEGRLIRPVVRTTIPGCIYYAMKRIKRGSDAKVLAAALEDGLRDITTKQATLYRVQVELRLLARLGIVSRTRPKKGARK